MTAPLFANATAEARTPPLCNAKYAAVAFSALARTHVYTGISLPVPVCVCVWCRQALRCNYGGSEERGVASVVRLEI